MAIDLTPMPRVSLRRRGWSISAIPACRSGPTSLGKRKVGVRTPTDADAFAAYLKTCTSRFGRRSRIWRRPRCTGRSPSSRGFSVPFLCFSAWITYPVIISQASDLQVLLP